MDLQLFDLTQLPQEVQDLLNKAAALPSNAALQTRLTGIETTLGGQITQETQNRINGDSSLQSQISSVVDNGEGSGATNKAYSEKRTEEIFASKTQMESAIAAATVIASESDVRGIVSGYTPATEQATE